MNRARTTRAAAPAATSIGDIAAVRRALLDHYDREARELPWRGESDPYRVLVSEIMLQQTRVETVERYYGPWLERFPDVEALATAEDDQVLKAWEGLGYYRRARNLHMAAQIVRDAGGRLPTEYDELRRLPGVGEYTAGAVASIAFGRAEPAVDGNVRRVLARVYDVAEPRPAWLRSTATALVDPNRPGDWNQALMELGATVCTPRTPACDGCPWRSWCAAAEAGTVAQRPAPKSRRRPRRATFALAVFEHGGDVLVAKRPLDGLLGGLWAFPEEEMPGGADGDAGTARAAVDRLADRTGVTLRGEIGALPPVRHLFTHLEARYLPRLAPVRERVEGPNVAWITPGAASDLSLPVAQRRVLDSVAEVRA